MVIMGHDPDCADGLLLDVKWNEQRFFQQRRDIAEVWKINLRMGTYERGVAVQDRAARPEIPGCSPVQVRSPLSCDGPPVEAFLLVGLLQEAEAGRMRAAQVQRRIREFLQNAAG